MIPNNQIPVQRRVAEAVSAKMNYDFLCFRGPIMGEAYLAHSISEILSSFFDQSTFRAKNNYKHPSFTSTAKQGRKPEIDYVVENIKDGKIILAMEAKWAGSSHCVAENILWDLVRLKAIKDSAPEQCRAFFLLAGKKEDMRKPFRAKIFQEGSHSPLIYASQRLKKFSLTKNRDHQKFINKHAITWTEKYHDFSIPPELQTKLEDDCRSAMEMLRFQAKVWEVK